jgi:hypothetical protein
MNGGPIWLSGEKGRNGGENPKKHDVIIVLVSRQKRVFPRVSHKRFDRQQSGGMFVSE